MRHSYLKAFTDIVHTLRGREKALARLSSLVWSAAACLGDTCLHLISLLLSSPGYKCCLCKEEANAPFRSNCEHVCCMKCWRTVFEGDKLCPECKVRVRRRHLVRLFFRSGQDFNNEVSTDPKSVT